MSKLLTRPEILLLIDGALVYALVLGAGLYATGVRLGIRSRRQRA
ncbi:MAG TPA: hypothetical protein VGB93_09525 [Methylovirgula sp.]